MTLKETQRSRDRGHHDPENEPRAGQGYPSGFQQDRGRFQQHEHERGREQRIVLLAEHCGERERQGGLSPPREGRDDRGRRRGPSQVLGPEGPAEKGLFGVHDPFVIQDEGQRHDDHPPPGLRGEGRSQPEKEVAQIERVTDHGVQSGGRQTGGKLRASVLSRRAFRGEADDEGPNDQPDHRDRHPRENESRLEPGNVVPAGALGRGGREAGQ